MTLTAFPRCVWAISICQQHRQTRCIRQEGHNGMHEARGPEASQFLQINWLPGDQRQFQSMRTDEQAWEVEEKPG